ncbi:hypothetical protein M885DRAFT_167442 [Pelagophyceae sp. CCMP2097]|nr:hypothetical protein M885DRAFT_167442 [Pelagophyceae sp. CCMP2097]
MAMLTAVRNNHSAAHSALQAVNFVCDVNGQRTFASSTTRRLVKGARIAFASAPRKAPPLEAWMVKSIVLGCCADVSDDCRCMFGIAVLAQFMIAGRFSDLCRLRDRLLRRRRHAHPPLHRRAQDGPHQRPLRRRPRARLRDGFRRDHVAPLGAPALPLQPDPSTDLAAPRPRPRALVVRAGPRAGRAARGAAQHGSRRFQRATLRGALGVLRFLARPRGRLHVARRPRRRGDDAEARMGRPRRNQRPRGSLLARLARGLRPRRPGPAVRHLAFPGFLKKAPQRRIGDPTVAEPGHCLYMKRQTRSVIGDRQSPFGDRVCCCVLRFIYGYGQSISRLRGS